MCKVIIKNGFSICKVHGLLEDGDRYCLHAEVVEGGWEDVVKRVGGNASVVFECGEVVAVEAGEWTKEGSIWEERFCWRWEEVPGAPGWWVRAVRRTFCEARW